MEQYTSNLEKLEFQIKFVSIFTVWFARKHADFNWDYKINELTLKECFYIFSESIFRTLGNFSEPDKQKEVN